MNGAIEKLNFLFVPSSFRKQIKVSSRCLIDEEALGILGISSTCDFNLTRSASNSNSQIPPRRSNTLNCLLARGFFFRWRFFFPPHQWLLFRHRFQLTKLKTNTAQHTKKSIERLETKENLNL